MQDEHDSTADNEDWADDFKAQSGGKDAGETWKQRNAKARSTHLIPHGMDGEAAFHPAVGC